MVVVARGTQTRQPLGNHPFSISREHHQLSSHRARAARAATPNQLATTFPAPDAATAVEVELLELLVPEAVPLAVELPVADPVADPVAEASVAVELPEAVAVALELAAVDEAVPVESAPVLVAVDEPEAVADAEEEEDELDSDSVMLNWFYTAVSYQHMNSLRDLDGGLGF